MFAKYLLKESDVEPLAEAVLRVLEQVGVLCQNDELRKALQEGGAQPDPSSEIVRFPRRVIENFVEGLRRENEGRDQWDNNPRAPEPAIISGQVAQFYYDDAAGQIRSASREHFITLTKFGDALHGHQGVGHSLSLTDVPPLLEPLYAGLLLAEYAHRPHAPFAWNVRQNDYLIEMGQILGLENWVSHGAICFAHPLRFDRDCADRFVRRVKEGVPTGLTGMPVAGATTPVTLEGFIAVACAEHVATWFAARALNPEVSLGGSMWAGTVDMKTGTVSYSAPDAMVYGAAAVEFLRRWCGMLVPLGAGDYCESRVPGAYTALEKVHKSLFASLLTGQPLAAGTGLIDNGRALSPVQLLLDRDFATALSHLGRPMNPTAEHLALDTIEQVGVGLDTNYLEAEHTLRHFRAALWLPEILDRSGWRGMETEEAVMEKALGKFHALLAEYRKPEGREEQLAAMRGVLERAHKELPG
ncbi:MAG: trimethylamine methyltransferase family protein [Armatimonadetes bacterium]|nr:trimethylamine methyltransferase family protein [Armatimonadota bacterium]